MNFIGFNDEKSTNDCNIIDASLKNKDSTKRSRRHTYEYLCND